MGKLRCFVGYWVLFASLTLAGVNMPTDWLQRARKFYVSLSQLVICFHEQTYAFVLVGVVASPHAWIISGLSPSPQGCPYPL